MKRKRFLSFYLLIVFFCSWSFTANTGADDTELAYGLPVRNFKSFNQAANEAAISRMYGGIHYRAAVEIGIKQGRGIGDFVIEKLNMIN